jgi:uncharacterized protein YecE (DUF72 family)
MVAPADRISVGVAGWSYPDWEGYVYPPRCGDKLAYVAQFVDVMEINSTFYRPPDRKTVESWHRRTQSVAGFSFTAKLHQDITHHGRLDPSTVRAFQEGFQPLSDAGRLRHLLAQFRYDFADSPPARDHLHRIREAFPSPPTLTLELRHVSWQEPPALEFLRSLGVNVATLDYPVARDSFRLRTCALGPHAYFRLHGRNAKAWFSQGAGRDETYNYLYNRTELGDIVKRALDLAEMTQSLVLVANNHYQGKEMVNALEIKAMIRSGRVPAPPPLIRRFPQLGDVAANPADTGRLL